MDANYLTLLSGQIFSSMSTKEVQATKKKEKIYPFFLFYSPIFVTYVYDFDSHYALKFAILYPTPLPLSNKSSCFFTKFCEKSIFRILEFNDTSKPNCWWGRAITYIGVVGCFSFT